VQLDGSPHDWLEGRGPQLTALGMQDDASGKILAAQFLLSETSQGYFRLLQSLLRRYGVPVAFYGDRSGVFTRNDDHWSLDEQLAGQRQPTQFGRALQQLGVTFIAAQSPQAKGRIERLWGVLQDRLTSELRLAQAHDLDSANRVLARFVADYNRRFARTPATHPTPGARLRKTLNASVASLMNASSATITLCNGTAAGCKSIRSPAASVSPEPKSKFVRPSMAGSRSTTATPGSSIPTLREGDIFMLPLG
jgi:hypothetical protein